MGFLASIFTWWNGATIGTSLFTRRHGREVGREVGCSPVRVDAEADDRARIRAAQVVGLAEHARQLPDGPIRLIDHDEVHARRALATTLWRLSKVAPEPLVEAAGETLRVAQGVRCDLIEFRTLLAEADPDDPGAALEAAISVALVALSPFAAGAAIRAGRT